MKTTQNVAFWLSDLTFVFGAKIQNIFGVFPTDFLMILVRVKVKTELATLPKNVIKKEAFVQVLVLKDTECVALVSFWLDISLWNCKELYLTVTIRCGETKNENCTYFESSGTESGACRVKICKCDPNVCQVCILKYFICIFYWQIQTLITVAIRFQFFRHFWTINHHGFSNQNSDWKCKYFRFKLWYTLGQEWLWSICYSQLRVEKLYQQLHNVSPIRSPLPIPVDQLHPEFAVQIQENIVRYIQIHFMVLINNTIV